MSNLIDVHKVSKSFGSFLAVDDISFNLKVGEILGFLGPNGAGKTTTMRMLTGFVSPTKGSIKVNNLDLKFEKATASKLFGYVPEGSPLYDEMTTINFLDFITEIRDISKADKENVINKVIKTLNLEKVVFQRIETLSKGYKRRVGLAQAIIHDPKILILDEPTDGLDPNQKNDVRKLIKKLGKDKGIIISTHILEEVKALCNRAMIINKGKVLIDEKPNNILKKSNHYNSLYIQVEEISASMLKNEISKMYNVKQISIKDNMCIINNINSDFKRTLNDFLLRKKYTLLNYTYGKGDFEEVFRSLTSDE